MGSQANAGCKGRLATVNGMLTEKNDFAWSCCLDRNLLLRNPRCQNLFHWITNARLVASPSRLRETGGGTGGCELES